MKSTVERLLARHNVRAAIRAWFEADQFLTIFELIRAGFGVSIVPDMARGLSEGCRLIEIEPKASRKVGYIRLQLRYLPKAIEAFTEYLKEAAEKRSR